MALQDFISQSRGGGSSGTSEPIHPSAVGNLADFVNRSKSGENFGVPSSIITPSTPSVEDQRKTSQGFFPKYMETMNKIGNNIGGAEASIYGGAVKGAGEFVDLIGGNIARGLNRLAPSVFGGAPNMQFNDAKEGTQKVEDTTDKVATELGTTQGVKDFSRTLGEFVGKNLPLMIAGNEIAGATGIPEMLGKMVGDVPMIGKYLSPVVVNTIKNLAGFSLADQPYAGQNNTVTDGDYTHPKVQNPHWDQFVSDLGNSALFGLSGSIPKALYSVPATGTAAYVSAKLGGASNGQALASALLIAGMHATGITGKENIDSQAEAMAKARGEAIDTINKYSKIQIHENSTPAEIDKAFHEAAFKTHPDVGGDTKTFQGVSFARDFLKNNPVIDGLGEGHFTQENPTLLDDEHPVHSALKNDLQTNMENGMTDEENARHAIISGVPDQFANDAVAQIRGDKMNGMLNESRTVAPEESMIPREVQAKAEKDWEDNYAEKTNAIDDKIGELRTQLAEIKDKQAKTEIQKQIDDQLKQSRDLENEFVNKWQIKAGDKVQSTKQTNAEDKLDQNSTRAKVKEPLSVKAQSYVDYHKSAIENIKDMIDEHPGKTIQRFASRKEGQFEDFKNPDYANSPSEAKKIIARNQKVMKAIQGKFDGTKWSDLFDNVDAIREAIDEYKDLQASLKDHQESLKDAKNGVIPSDYIERVLKTDKELFNTQGGFVNPGSMVADLREKLDKVIEGQESAKMGEAIRGYFVGERDTRIAETNQIREKLEKSLTPKEQEAITFYRDFKGEEGKLAELLKDPKLEPYRKVIELAMKPTDAMLKADKVITEFGKKVRAQEEKLKILTTTIDDEKYITHLLAPAETVHGKTGIFGRNKIGRSDPFAKQRTYDTVADAIKAGVKVKSVNALDAMTIRGEKWGVAVGTKMLLKQLKISKAGKFGFKGSDNIPKEWVPADPSNRYFRNTIPFTNEEGKASVAYQDLFVPEKVADAISALVTGDFTGKIPGFTTWKSYQAYLKGVQLSLSIFHLKALNITALNNEGITGLVKSYASDMKSPEFLDAEKYWIQRGLTSPILGKTIEAYKGLVDTSVPTRMQILKGLPGIKQADELAKGITHLTFGIMQRKFKITDAELKGTSWKLNHPDATPAETMKAERAIAAEVNATYGGLNWEVLGWSKSALSVARFLLLAPDWTYSNWLNAKTAFTGGAGGSAARMFWLRSIITGMVLTYLTSTILNGKPPKPSYDNFTSVYLGKDKNGKDVYQNIWFAGAPADAINLVNNVSDYGVIQGTANTLAAKGSPGLKGSIQLLTNRNYLGQTIVPKGMGVVAGTARSLYTLATTLGPVPFSLSNMFSMFTDPTKQYSPKEYITSIFGSKPRHVIPAGDRVVPSGRNKGKVVPDRARTPLPLLEQIKTGKLNKPLRAR